MQLKKLLPLCLLSIILASPFSLMAADTGKGKVLYQEKCAACHGADGKAVLPGSPNFNKGDRMEKSNVVLKKSVLNGLNAMPPFKGALSDANVGDVLAYIRKLKK
ncbi:MAG TPA: cytochrome c [Acidiferrobacteraceae bacterium]|nr:cytochrome c [Acidiferrobacteraceae bacterium]HEX20128.1 cytochrome c [Acidiferrobacteraceae bacterium]